MPSKNAHTEKKQQSQRTTATQPKLSTKGTPSTTNPSKPITRESLTSTKVEKTAEKTAEPADRQATEELKKATEELKKATDELKAAKYELKAAAAEATAAEKAKVAAAAAEKTKVAAEATAVEKAKVAAEKTKTKTKASAAKTATDAKTAADAAAKAAAKAAADAKTATAVAQDDAKAAGEKAKRAAIKVVAAEDRLAALVKAAAEKKAAEKAALEKAEEDRRAAEKAAEKAAEDRRAAEKAAEKAAEDRRAAEKAAAEKAAAEKAAAEKAAAEKAAAEKAAAEKAAAEKAAAEKKAAAKQVRSTMSATATKYVALKTHHDIEDLRKKLFVLKTTNKGMMSFKESINKMHNTHDLYNIRDNNNNNNNIEHVIPVIILGKREYLNSFDHISRAMDSNFYINYESYSDMHIMFMTNARVNTLRGDSSYDNVAASLCDVIKYNNINYKKSNNSYILVVYKDKGIITECIPGGYNTSVSDNESVGKKQNEFKEMIKIKVAAYNTKRIFEPPDSMKGSIARIVFYYYLMYVHNIARRPVVLDGMIDDLWQAYVKKDSTSSNTHPSRMIDYMNGYRFNKSDWTNFFKEIRFYEWHKKYPVSEIEHDRNKHVISQTNVPNIFVGYYNKDGTYLESNPDIVDYILFGDNVPATVPATVPTTRFDLNDIIKNIADIDEKANEKITRVSYDPYLSPLIAINKLDYNTSKLVYNLLLHSLPEYAVYTSILFDNCNKILESIRGIQHGSGDYSSYRRNKNNYKLLIAKIKNKLHD
jgi:endonuclease I